MKKQNKTIIHRISWWGWFLIAFILFYVCVYSTGLVNVLARLLLLISFASGAILGTNAIFQTKWRTRYKVLVYTSSVVAILMIITAMVGLIENAKNQETQVSHPAELPLTRANLLVLVNQERAKNGVAPLLEATQLDQSSQYKADDLVSRNYYSHDDPATGKSNGLEKAFELTGTSCAYISENIDDTGSENESATFAVDAWDHSPAHHQAMIDPRYTYTGFGINGHIVVEHFCQPK